MTTRDLPTFNAICNAVSAVLLVMGFAFIRSGNRKAHMRCMLSAFTASVLFLSGYLTFHFLHGSTKFQGTGAWRTAYFTILISHTILAIVIVPLVIITLSRALSQRFDKHKRIARVTFPLWLYVSVTGVVVYLMLYRLTL